MAVVLTKAESGFVADILRADSLVLLRAFLEGEGPVDAVHVLASGQSAREFDA